MLMYPSATYVSISLYHKGAAELWLGSVHVPVDSFFEPPGILNSATFCGKNCPRLCNRFLGTEYRWPFVRGAPSNHEWRLLRAQENSCCWSPEGRERAEIVRHAGDSVLYQSEFLPGETERWPSGQKF